MGLPRYYACFLFQAVKLRLIRANTHMIFLLPHSKDALPYIIEKMYADPNYLTPFLNRMTVDRPIVVKIPRFNMKSYVDWTGFLQDVSQFFNMGLFILQFACANSILVIYGHPASFCYITRTLHYKWFQAPQENNTCVVLFI